MTKENFPSNRSSFQAGDLFWRPLCIVTAALLMALDLNTFVKSANLFPGGFTGLALLLQQCAEKFGNIHLPFTLTLVVLNAIPAIASFFFIGKKYTLLSCQMILLSGVRNPTYSRNPTPW